MSKLFKYLLTITAILFCSVLSAQLEDTSIVNTVVVTAQIQPTTSSRSVHMVKIITAATIEKQGSVNLKDVLSKELNVRIGNDNILGSSLSLQGISGQNVKILLDGVPLTGRENGNIDLGQINLSNIERIEIIEGPLSVIYGTDALGGVINLISKKITIDKPAVGHANMYYETSKQYNFGGGGTVKLNDIDFNASINRNFFGGFALEDNLRVMLWKPKEQIFGSFSILKQTGKLKMRFKTDIFNEKIQNRGVPVISHVEAYAFDEYYLTNRNINSLNLDYKINNRSFLNILTAFNFYQRDRITYRKDLVTNQENIVNSAEANSSDRFLNFMSRGTYSKMLDSSISYQLGYDINMNSAFGTKIVSDKGKMNDYAVFACAEIKPFRHLSIKPGFRATYNTRYPAPFIPSIQLQFSKIKNTTLRYSYGRGFRAPGLKELYLYFVDYNHNIVGNPDLQSEMSDNHNASVRYKLKVKKLIFYIENNYFYNMIYNQIAIVAVNPVALEYTYRNIDNFKSLGSNINIASQIGNFRFNVGGSYTGIYNSAFEQSGKKRFNYSPELRTQLSYTVSPKRSETTGKTTFSIYQKYNGQTMGYALDDTRNIITTTTEAYNILDFTVNRPFLKRKLNLTLGCKNILNITTIMATGNSSSIHSGGSNTMPVSVGRSLFVQLNINL